MTRNRCSHELRILGAALLALLCSSTMADQARPAAADLILFRARFMTELLSRPQSDRIVLRAGRVLQAEAPDWRELDPLFTSG